MSDVRDDAHGTSVARQLSLPLGQAQRKRAQQMCKTTRASPQECKHDRSIWPKAIFTLLTEVR